MLRRTNSWVIASQGQSDTVHSARTLSAVPSAAEWSTSSNPEQVARGEERHWKELRELVGVSITHHPETEEWLLTAEDYLRLVKVIFVDEKVSQPSNLRVMSDTVTEPLGWIQLSPNVVLIVMPCVERAAPDQPALQWWSGFAASVAQYSQLDRNCPLQQRHFFLDSDGQFKAVFVGIQQGDAVRVCGTPDPDYAQLQWHLKAVKDAQLLKETTPQDGFSVPTDSEPYALNQLRAKLLIIYEALPPLLRPLTVTPTFRTDVGVEPKCILPITNPVKFIVTGKPPQVLFFYGDAWSEFAQLLLRDQIAFTGPLRVPVIGINLDELPLSEQVAKTVARIEVRFDLNDAVLLFYGRTLHATASEFILRQEFILGQELTPRMIVVTETAFHDFAETMGAPSFIVS